MARQLNMNKMKFISKNTQKVLLCIVIGTTSGLLVYGLFLHFNIAIFGWNLGLIFAPLVAGYVETIFANKIIGKNIGAKSAFILFLDTTIYSFLLKNPTLGFNLITVGSIIIILQAAFPTLINHIILVVIGGLIPRAINKFRKTFKKIKNLIRNQSVIQWNGTNELKTTPVPYFDERESNNNLNSLNFFFLTSSDITDQKHDKIRIYQSIYVLEKEKRVFSPELEKVEMGDLVKLKEGKDECLIDLVNQIKNDGGNGILDLTMNYTTIGFGGENIQITATGLGIFIY